MHRFFSPEPVEDELLARLVWAADRAPHGGGQLYRLVVVVTDRALVRTIEQVSPGLGIFSQTAPAMIVICSVPADAEAAGGAYARDVATHLDAGAAAENVALAAAALGLGTCFVTGFNEVAIREILELPAGVRPEILLPIGRPAAVPSPTMKAPTSPVFRDRYAAVWDVTWKP
jgi:nitroreductase